MAIASRASVTVSIADGDKSEGLRSKTPGDLRVLRDIGLPRITSDMTGLHKHVIESPRRLFQRLELGLDIVAIACRLVLFEAARTAAARVCCFGSLALAARASFLPCFSRLGKSRNGFGHRISLQRTLSR